MTGTKLLTREDFLKENFNTIKIDTKDVKRFLLYFGGILELAISGGLINENERNIISNTITNAIEFETLQEDDDDCTNYIQIRNYMYIINSYLQSKSNWDAWLELRTIKSAGNANVLIHNAKTWITRKLKDSETLLTTIKPSISKLNISTITNAYKILSATLKNAITSTSDITTFDVKEYHNIALNIGTYILMDEFKLQNEENFFEELCSTIYNFYMEISILSKINAKKLIHDKKNEITAYFTNISNRAESINHMYKDKLSSLKREYSKKLKNCDDQIQADKEYLKAKSNIEKEWEEKLAEFEKQLVKEEICQFEILNGEYSLYDLIKEYAIYGMALKEEIYYPSTMKERNVMLMVIDNKHAISEFISATKQVLTNEQIEFLKDKM